MTGDEDEMDGLDAHLSHVCRDLTEVLDDEGLDQICYDLNAVLMKKKSNIAKKQGQNKPHSKKTKHPIQNSSLMKDIFWNSRGLGDFAKHNFLLDVVKEQS